MTRLLVSVRDVAEARIAVEAGAELIDVKEPARGSLGRAPAAEIARIARLVDGKVPLSAALGELVDWNPKGDEPVVPTGVGFAKWGLSGCGAMRDWPARFAQAVSRLPAPTRPVAVVYADWRTSDAPSPDDVLRWARELGCGAALIDTFDKSCGDLFAYWSEDELARWIGDVKRSGMLSVVGGSLDCQTLCKAVSAGCDVIAVRGAACAGSRERGLDGRRIGDLVMALREAEGAIAR